jgi:hypothetical protein
MDSIVRDLGSLAITLAVGGGPVFVLIALLNHRDRRRARLLSLAARQVTGEAARGEVAVEARCSLLASGGVVRVDMGGLEGGEVRRLIERLRQALPPAIRLEITGDVRPGAYRRAWAGAPRAASAVLVAGSGARASVE